MDLARQKQSLDTLLINLKIAYDKLDNYHKKTRSSQGQGDRMWIPKNISKPVIEPTQKNEEMSVDDDKSKPNEE